jgi:hypothetical protein
VTLIGIRPKEGRQGVTAETLLGYGQISQQGQRFAPANINSLIVLFNSRGTEQKQFQLGHSLNPPVVNCTGSSGENQWRKVVVYPRLSDYLVTGPYLWYDTAINCSP